MEDGLVSMTETLCDSLYVKELESRLETDPLVAGGLLQFMGDNGDLKNSLAGNSRVMASLSDLFLWFSH